jgi:hypothetical protein
VFLAHEFGETPRAPLACEDEVGHRGPCRSGLGMEAACGSLCQPGPTGESGGCPEAARPV